MSHARIATAEDGISPAEAGRRTTYAIGDAAGAAARALVRTRFTDPRTVEVLDVLAPDDLAALANAVADGAPQVAVVTMLDTQVPLPAPRDIHWIPLAQLRVGQSSVDADKLAACWWVQEPEDVIVTAAEADGELVVIDGTTRAVAAQQRGIETVGVVLVDIDPAAAAARRACRDAGIDTVADLAGHVLPHARHLAAT